MTPATLRQGEGHNPRKRALLETMAAFEERGTPIRAARISNRGHVELLTEAPAVTPIEDGDWTELAGAETARAA